MKKSYHTNSTVTIIVRTVQNCPCAQRTDYPAGVPPPHPPHGVNPAMDLCGAVLEARELLGPVSYKLLQLLCEVFLKFLLKVKLRNFSYVTDFSYCLLTYSVNHHKLCHQSERLVR